MFDNDKEAEQRRLPILSTRSNLEIFGRSTNWAMDGTFDTAPPLFAQIYSIHATYVGRTHPLVFGILPNKRRTTYDSFFAGLQEISNNNLHPTMLITDFEMAAKQACNAVFPNANQTGCFFNLT